MIAFRRLRQRGDEGGFALVFVLLVTTIAMIGVATTFAVATPNITASKTSQDAAAALLAAQSGINDAVAYLTNIPACRSETRICTDALGKDSIALKRAPLGSEQTFHWSTASQTVSDPTYGDLVRVTSVGTEDGVSRTLIADLSLNPSILDYGYYTDYESQTPKFFNAYYGQRSIDITNSSTYSYVNQVSTRNYSLPRTITWNGAGTNAPSGYSDSVCAQHWYSDGSNSPGRGNATNGSTWYESGSLNSQTVYHGSSCDLVFTAGMTENGPTYTRDAIDIANGSGNGPIFNQPVYTLWGYAGKNSPAAPSAQPWRQSDGSGQDLLPSSPYKPQIATQDITLPTSIGTDGIQTDSCVYYGPTRVVLNGDGTATVTSPATTNAPTGADPRCYPNDTTNGVINFTLNYANVGSGTIYVKNLNTPTSGSWPVSTLKATSTPSASNEIFYLPATGGSSIDPNTRTNTTAAPFSSCSSTNTYSATPSATCAWTNTATPTDASSASGWTAYSATSKCNTISTTSTDRQAFECDYSKIAGQSKTPGSSGFSSIRSAIAAGITNNSCAGSATTTAAASCLAALATSAFTSYNTSTYRYVPTATPGTTTTSTNTIGNVPTTPVANDSFFTTTPSSAASETDSTTPITVTVGRETYNTSNKTWGSPVPQFSYTTTLSQWSFTPASNGASYFPSTQDVTQYAIGANSTGSAAGSKGTSQPGDLYVEGTNQGTLSLIAQNNVEVTGNITKGPGQDSSAANPVSITAGNDIRNYHPVSCSDQTAADINATSPGWCPNDITGATSYALLNSDGSYTAQNPAAQYSNINANVDRTIDAALFTLTGSLRTDNFDRGNFVGKLIVNGGIYQSHRGANGVTYSNGSNTPGRSGTSLNYNYVDLERANLQYVPSASYSANPRVWNIVSISDGS